MLDEDTTEPAPEHKSNCTLLFSVLFAQVYVILWKQQSLRLYFILYVCLIFWRALELFFVPFLMIVLLHEQKPFKADARDNSIHTTIQFLLMAHVTLQLCFTTGEHSFWHKDIKWNLDIIHTLLSSVITNRELQKLFISLFRSTVSSTREGPVFL